MSWQDRAPAGTLANLDMRWRALIGLGIKSLGALLGRAGRRGLAAMPSWNWNVRQRRCSPKEVTLPTWCGPNTRKTHRHRITNRYQHFPRYVDIEGQRSAMTAPPHDSTKMGIHLTMTVRNGSEPVRFMLLGAPAAIDDR